MQLGEAIDDIVIVWGDGQVFFFADALLHCLGPRTLTFPKDSDYLAALRLHSYDDNVTRFLGKSGNKKWLLERRTVRATLRADPALAKKTQSINSFAIQLITHTQPAVYPTHPHSLPPFTHTHTRRSSPPLCALADKKADNP